MEFDQLLRFIFILQVTVYLGFGGWGMAVRGKGKHPGCCSPIFPIQAKRKQPVHGLLFMSRSRSLKTCMFQREKIRGQGGIVGYW